MKFYLPTLKHLVIQLSKLQIYTSNLTTTFWHCKKKSHYFWTGVYLFHHSFRYGTKTYYYRSANHSDVVSSIHCAPLSNYLTVIYVCQDLFLANLLLVFQLTHFLLFNLGVVMTNINETNYCKQYNDDKASYDLTTDLPHGRAMGCLLKVLWR